MKQSEKAKKLSGPEGFNSYYSEIFPEDWEQLREALLKENVHFSLQFPYCESYFLDPASICAALCLPLISSDDLDEVSKVVDMCAAPGGKTLVLASNLKKNHKLYSNERSGDRKNRLCKVVSDCLPADLQKQILVSCSDASTWCKRESECYSSILLDAPCSSERHVLTDPKYLKGWTPSRIKSIAMEQWALISSAWRLLAPKGYLLYSTCALNPTENDFIISKLLKKFGNVKIISPEETYLIFTKNLKSSRADFKISYNSTALPEENCLEKIYSAAKKTENGYHILPHKAFGCGPIYFCLLQKQ